MVAAHVFRLPLLSAILIAAAMVGCGPSAATPMPEPPSIDVNRIGAGEEIHTATEPSPLQLQGRAGAATPHATVRVINLEDTSDAVATTVAADGSFAIDIVVSANDELRFEASTPEGTSAPVDVRVNTDRSDVTAVTRPSCLVLDGGYGLDVEAGATNSVEVTNQCDETLSLENARLRLGQGGFSVETTLPLVLAPGESGLVDVRLESSATGRPEDILFFDVTIAGTVVRYPVSLRAP